MRKINLVNTDIFPKDVPSVLVCNHPTAFLEPCLLACFMDRPLYFMVRGDYFKNPFYRKLMFGVNLIPIHRLEGGIEHLRKNHEIFEYCYDVLDKDQVILIMGEGKTRQHKRLGPLKKGTGRLSLGFMSSRERYDGLIVPVGVNFSQADHWRTDVSICVKDWFSMEQFKEDYAEHPNIAYQKLNEETEKALRACMVFIEHEEDDDSVEFLLHFIRINYINPVFPGATKKVTEFEKMQKLAESFNRSEDRAGLRQSVRELVASLIDKSIDYKHLKIDGFSVLRSYLLILLMAPIALLGILTNGVSYYLAYTFAIKKTKKREFEHPVRAAVLLGVNLFIWPILIVFTLWTGIFWLFLIYLIKPLLAYLALKYYDLVVLHKHSIRFNRQSESYKSEFRMKLEKIYSKLLA